MAGELAKRMDDLSGPEKAAVIMLALGNDHGAQLWPLMDDEEIRDISMAMASLGKIDPEVIELLVNGDADIFAESNPWTAPSACCVTFCHKIVSTRSWRKSAVRPDVPCGTNCPT